MYTNTTASGAHSPNIVWEKLRSLTVPSLNYTVAGTLTFLHTQNKETICIVLSFDIDIVMYSSVTSSFTMSEWLVPTLWSLVLISLAVTSAVYAPSSWITWGSLVDPPLHWVLCRWLAGVYQRITTPLFLMVINCHMFFYPLSLLQDHYTTTMRECQVFIRIFIIFLYVSYLLFSAPHLIISPFSQMSRGVREVVPERLDVRI